ncbi:MAG: hypothetical protein IJC27_08815 [Lentisphaeria bacterium]|nr:hypothetical protein [Lentisphaeria bacterium]
MKKYLLTAFIAAALFPQLHARVRVDIQSSQVTVKDIQAQGMSIGTTPAKAVENISRAVLISGNSGKEWKKYQFSFVPEKEGRVALRFHTPGARNAAMIKNILLDSVNVEGGTLLNGGFEIMHNGKLSNWGLGAKGKIVSTGAYEGKQCVQLCFSSGMATQIMVVTAGEKVTVTFMAKSADL